MKRTWRIIKKQQVGEDFLTLLRSDYFGKSRYIIVRHWRNGGGFTEEEVAKIGIRKTKAIKIFDGFVRVALIRAYTTRVLEELNEDK